MELCTAFEKLRLSDDGEVLAMSISGDEFENSDFSELDEVRFDFTFNEDSFPIVPSIDIFDNEPVRKPLQDFEGPVMDEGSLPFVKFLRSIMRPVPTEIVDGLNIMNGNFNARALLDFVKGRNVSQFLVVVKSKSDNLGELERFVNNGLRAHPILFERCILVYVTIDESTKKEVSDRANQIGMTKKVKHATLAADDFVTQMLSRFGFGPIVTKDKYEDREVVWNLFAGTRLLVSIYKGYDFMSDNVIINLM